MKKLSCFFLIIVFLLSSCTSDGVKTQQDNLKDYTFLIYMNGSDLESEHSAGTTDLYEMMKVGSNENINILVETGGTKKWNNYYINPNINQRWIVQKNKLEWLLDLEQRNMGNADTLSDFIIWGIQNFPAKKYALILWNHGGGAITGFGYDEKNYFDTLLLVELEKALKKAKEVTNETLEIIGFDACLMASLETADVVAPYAKYLVASAELEPAMGWEYSYFLKKAAEGNIDGIDLGKYIAEGFFREAQKRDMDEMVTLSVIDTAKTEKVKENFENFVNKVSTKLEEPIVFNDLSKSVSKSEYYGGKSLEEGFSNMIDLGDFAVNLGENFKDEKYKILDSVKEAVLYNVKGKAKQNSTGLSIYFPYYPSENLDYELPIYKTIGFSDNYHRFINKYVNIASNKGQKNVDIVEKDIKINGNTLVVRVSDSMKENILKSYPVVGREIKNGKVLLYGHIHGSDYKIEDSKIISHFDGELISLNGNLVYGNINSHQDEYIVYSIPAILNDEYVNIRAIYYKEKDVYEILGAWHGVIPENLAIRKEIIELKEGDKLIPLLKEYDVNTGEIETVEGEEFVIEKSAMITNIKVKQEDIVIGFCIEDCALNKYFTDFVKIN